MSKGGKGMGGGGNGDWSLEEAQEVEDPENAEENNYSLEEVECKGKDCPDSDDENSLEEVPCKGKNCPEEDENGGPILGGEETIVPSSQQAGTTAPVVPDPINTSAPTVARTNPPTVAPVDPPTGIPSIAPSIFTTTVSSTGAPTVQTEFPTIAVTQSQTQKQTMTAQAPTQSYWGTLPANTSEPKPSQAPTIGDSQSQQKPSPNGIFNGEEYYHLHLKPFGVSIEGDPVDNDLGITSCLHSEMQKNMSNLFTLEMDNFTIVQFEDEDGDGYKRYDLYFEGFGELIGMPVYTEEYFQNVQLEVLGNGAEFIQSCLDMRWADSGKSFTASALGNEQSVDAAQGDNSDELGGEGEDDSKMRTNLIIGLTVAAVVVALCGVIFASRVLRNTATGASAEETAALK